MRGERIVSVVLLAAGNAVVLLMSGCGKSGQAEDVKGWSYFAAPEAGSAAQAEQLRGWLVPSEAVPLFKAIDRDMDDLQRKKAKGSISEQGFGTTLLDLVRRYREAEERWSYEAGELRRDLTRMGAEGSMVDADVRDDVQRRYDEGLSWSKGVKEKLLRRGAKLSPVAGPK
jgi:hypothetical protein